MTYMCGTTLLDTLWPIKTNYLSKSIQNINMQWLDRKMYIDRLMEDISKKFFIVNGPLIRITKKNWIWWVSRRSTKRKRTIQINIDRYTDRWCTRYSNYQRNISIFIFFFFYTIASDKVNQYRSSIRWLLSRPTKDIVVGCPCGSEYRRQNG